MDLISREGANGETINVASPCSVRMLGIVHEMERVLGARAVFDILDKGSPVPIDTSRISASIKRCAIAFGDAYVGNIIEKYYGVYRNTMNVSNAYHPNRPAVFHSPAWQS